jgi:hypothetical protein
MRHSSFFFLAPGPFFGAVCVDDADHPAAACLRSGGSKQLTH